MNLPPISIPANCDYIEVILLRDVLYHCKSNLKIDRLQANKEPGAGALYGANSRFGADRNSSAGAGSACVF